MLDKEKSSMSEARKRANAKHDKENFQYITFKARKGSRERIVEAATVTGQSTNSFIRSTLNKAVRDATGVPMEHVLEPVKTMISPDDILSDEDIADIEQARAEFP